MKTEKVLVSRNILYNLVGSYSLLVHCDSCPFGHNGTGACVSEGWNDDETCRETLVKLLTGKETL